MTRSSAAFAMSLRIATSSRPPSTSHLVDLLPLDETQHGLAVIRPTLRIGDRCQTRNPLLLESLFERGDSPVPAGEGLVLVEDRELELRMGEDPARAKASTKRF